jgi:hypothetical protein
MHKINYTNRYNDTYTFAKTEDGNILFQGDFKWLRCGWPNVYDVAYHTYCSDIDDDEVMTLGEFKKAVHEAIYDSEGKYVSMSEISTDYASLAYSDTTKIDMIDPSGGPYLHSGHDMGHYHDSFRGMIIDHFKAVPEGYLIIIKNK